MILELIASRLADPTEAARADRAREILTALRLSNLDPDVLTVDLAAANARVETLTKQVGALEATHGAHLAELAALRDAAAVTDARLRVQENALSVLRVIANGDMPDVELIHSIVEEVDALDG